MFLPEDLLFKSGQLARVWLAANQHKKLTKAQVLQDKIDEDIQVIMRPEGRRWRPAGSPSERPAAPRCRAHLPSQGPLSARRLQ